MINKKSFLAIIPARGGSKRLPRKNILDLNGKPLVAWSIEAGLQSKYIDKIIVSSDDKEILDISQKYGASIIERPDELATDIATTFDVIKHTINAMDKGYDYIVLLQATSPLRDKNHIDEAIELLEKKGADAIVSVCEMEHSPFWSNTLDNTLSMDNFLIDDVKNKRSQDLKPYYRLNGAIYICNTKLLLKENTFFLMKNIFAYIMGKQYSIDIDEEYDLIVAKAYCV